MHYRDPSRRRAKARARYAQDAEVRADACARAKQQRQLIKTDAERKHRRNVWQQRYRSKLAARNAAATPATPRFGSFPP
jgi:hypothetical protein